MKKALRTLEDYRNMPIRDLFRGVILKCVPNKSSPDSSAKKLADLFARGIIQHEFSPEIINEMDKIIEENAEKGNLEILVSREITVLLKEEEQYFDLTDNNQILGEENGTYIEKLEPFSELYSKSEYSFEEKNGRIYLVVVMSKDIQKYEMKTFV